MRARLEILQKKNPKAQLRQQWVPYTRISGHLKRAIIAAEDAKFVSHNGFDWDGIQKAYEKNLREGEIVAGGSTITQQLAKNLFFSGERTWWRKAQEAVVAVMIETVMSKRRILEIYLNVMGRGRVRRRSGGPPSLRHDGSWFDARAGGTPGVDRAQPAALRTGQRYGLSAAAHADHIGADERVADPLIFRFAAVQRPCVSRGVLSSRFRRQFSVDHRGAPA
jgi:hypothetical protein